MAKAQKISRMAVQRIWNTCELNPHLVETFKLSKDPRFVEKLTDVVGLYLDPPDRALVLCVDEKSQIQALERTQPLLPLAALPTAKRFSSTQRILCGVSSVTAGWPDELPGTSHKIG